MANQTTDEIKQLPAVRHDAQYLLEKIKRYVKDIHGVDLSHKEAVKIATEVLKQETK